MRIKPTTEQSNDKLEAIRSLFAIGWKANIKEKSLEALKACNYPPALPNLGQLPGINEIHLWAKVKELIIAGG